MGCHVQMFNMTMRHAFITSITSTWCHYHPFKENDKLKYLHARVYTLGSWKKIQPQGLIMQSKVLIAWQLHAHREGHFVRGGQHVIEGHNMIPCVEHATCLKVSAYYWSTSPNKHEHIDHLDNLAQLEHDRRQTLLMEKKTLGGIQCCEPP